MKGDDHSYVRGRTIDGHVDVARPRDLAGPLHVSGADRWMQRVISGVDDHEDVVARLLFHDLYRARVEIEPPANRQRTQSLLDVTGFEGQVVHVCQERVRSASAVLPGQPFVILDEHSLAR